MNRFRHWTASLVSRVDWMVSQVENHEALADSAIRDLGHHAARARVQMARVRADGRAIQQRRDREREAVSSWRDRARRQDGPDDTRALECLRRARTAERQASELDRRLAEHEQVERQLARDLGRVEQQLTTLRGKRNLMRTRQSRADALAAVGDCEDVTGLDDVFDRWEERITERELLVGCGDGPDRFEAELEEAELDDALRAELAALRAEPDAPARDDA